MNVCCRFKLQWFYLAASVLIIQGAKISEKKPLHNISVTRLEFFFPLLQSEYYRNTKGNTYRLYLFVFLGSFSGSLEIIRSASFSKFLSGPRIRMFVMIPSLEMMKFTYTRSLNSHFLSNFWIAKIFANMLIHFFLKTISSF